MTSATRSIIWLVREFVFTVVLSFLIVTSILWVFFETPMSKTTPSVLLSLIAVCTTIVFVIIGAVYFVYRLVVPADARKGDMEMGEVDDMAERFEDEDGLVMIAKSDQEL